MQYTERERAKHVLKARFYSKILQLYTRYSGTDTQGGSVLVYRFKKTDTKDQTIRNS